MENDGFSTAKSVRQDLHQEQSWILERISQSFWDSLLEQFLKRSWVFLKRFKIANIALGPSKYVASEGSL